MPACPLAASQSFTLPAVPHLSRYSILDTPYSHAHLTPVPRLLSTLLLLPLSLLATDRPSVGAIRWDAWSGGGVTEQVEHTLSPEKYRFRLPWFAVVDTAGRANIKGAADGVMEQEIAYAKNAGLDYWAFLTYPEADSMSSALARYLRSPKRPDLGFCLILHQTLSVPAPRWPAERDRVVKLMQEPGYQKTHGRPLVYTFDVKTEQPTIKQRFEELRAAAKVAGLDPYFVYMGWNPARDYQAHASEGFATVSAYAHPGTEPVFAKYVAAFEQHAWSSALANKIPYAPLVTTGWDKRPRQDHPVSWEKNPGYADQKTFPATATPAEIAAHLGRALTFVKAHPDICPANTVIIYAWNEHDEGGWLCPTWTPSGKPDTARLDAIRTVLR
jgi:Glycosyltransferase WbsX